MARKRIRPEVLRPLVLVLVIIIALFVLQFWRPIPPDIRQQQRQDIYEKDLKILYAALQEYQRTYNTLPSDWADLAKTNFSFESIKLPDREPDQPKLVQTPQGIQVQSMPFELVKQGRVDWTGTPEILVQFPGSGQTGSVSLYLFTNGVVQRGGAG